MGWPRLVRKEIHPARAKFDMDFLFYTYIFLLNVALQATFLELKNGNIMVQGKTR